MRRKNTPAIVSDEPELDGFARQVEAALEHVGDARWLGEQSPLAAPYLLGQALTSEVFRENTQKRGQVLQAILSQATEELETEFQKLLNLTFLQRNPKLDGEDLAIALHMSRRNFYRKRARAIQALADCMQQRLQPALRPELPVRVEQLVGRGATIQNVLHVLRGGRSFYLYGVSGIGKTSLAAAVARIWSSNRLQGEVQGQSAIHARLASAVMWYTVRPSLNDQLSSLVFALAYFLHGLGASHTWRQLIADKGVLQGERVLGLIRYDFSLLPVKPLVCIDEVDMLQPESDEHKQLLHLIEELRSQGPLLLIGQRVAIETSEQIKVEGLDDASLVELFIQAKATLPSPDIRQRILAKTDGNPALLILILTLLRFDDEIEEILASLSEIAALDALFLRMWRRLDQTERICMMQLSVYRNPAPLDAFAAQHPIINQLLQRYLLQQDEYSAISVLPHIRLLIYERIPDKLRNDFHLHALSVRSDRAQIVSAMYHALAAKQPIQAVWLWFKHRTREIERGQSAPALRLLEAISLENLPDERDLLALQISRAELHKMLGNFESAEVDIRNANGTDKLASAYIQQLQGDILGIQGRLDQALTSYRTGLTQLWGTPEQRSSILHNRSSYYYLDRFQDIANARRESLLARAEAEIRHGRVEERAGDYSIAEERFVAACHLVEQVENEFGVASRAYSHLGKLRLKQNKIDSGIELLEKSIKFDQQRGDVVSPLYDRINLSYAFTIHGRFTEALQQAQDGLQFAEKMKVAYLIAGLAAAAGEACFGLDRLDESEHYVLQSLQQEEEFFRSWAFTIFGMVRGKQGSIEEASRHFHAAIQAAQEIEDKYGEAYAWRKLGDVHAAADQRQAAQDAYQHALELYRKLGLNKEINELEALLS